MKDSYRANKRLEELFKQLEKREEVKKEVLTGQEMEDYNDQRIKEIKDSIVEVVRNLI